MNTKQRTILLATAFVLIVMLLFPPFSRRFGQGVTVNRGYSFIFAPPTGSDVNLALLALQYLIVVTVGGILTIALNSRQTPLARRDELDG